MSADSLAPSPDALPLVSCVMPTYGRPDYVAESLAMFLAQDWPAKELILLNDCAGQSLVGDYPGVRIVNVQERCGTLGEKRNAAIEMAKGEYIAVWDDDDVYFPWRLSYCLRRMQELQADLYCPADYWAYWGTKDLHENEAVMHWIYHPQVIFRKELWKAVGGYPAQTLSEDTAFFSKVLEHLGMEWPRDPIKRFDRVMIMRGTSKYSHTSITGGTDLPDTRPGEIRLAPAPIADPVLRQVTEELTIRRTRNVRYRQRSHYARESLAGMAPHAERVWLDEHTPGEISIGYGEIGLRGSLGYEDKHVEVCGERIPRAISAHAPSRVTYALQGKFSEFRSLVAINDSAPAGNTSADFFVVADGTVVGAACNIVSGSQPQLITADIRGAQRLELRVQTRRWNFCHSVWLNPELLTIPAESSRYIVDCLERAEIGIPTNLAPSELCIATAGSQGYEDWIDDLLGSICANARCPEATFAIFSFGDSPEIRQVADKYCATVIPCRPLRPLNASSKAVLYAAGHVIPASKFICLDADMLVLDDLRPLLATMDAAPPGSILVCREANWAQDLEQALTTFYHGHSDDISSLIGGDAMKERRYSLVVNDGLFAGTRAAICAIDHRIRGLHQPAHWVDDPNKNVPWRNQFIFNLALAAANSGVELDHRFNVQLHCQQAELRQKTSGIVASTGGFPVAIVHFNGAGRHHGPKWRGQYRAFLERHQMAVASHTLTSST